MEIKIIKTSINREELKKIAEKQFGDLVKAVVDVEKGIMAIGPDLHSDGEILLEKEEGSKREHIWGINLRLEEDELVEFDSVINLKPVFNNRSRNVENPKTREKIKEIVNNLII